MKQVVVSVLLFVLATFGYAGDFEEGVKAYNAGEYKKALKLYEKACDGGDASGCYNSGWMYEKGREVKQNYATAKRYYGVACDGGLQIGCDSYARLNKQGY